jgi:hypothetical protein
MILYKYCPPERVDIFESTKIGLTRPRSFNDPFELSPNISSVADGMEMSRQTRDRTKDYAALCFAESADDPLMWGHYGAGLNGFVIAFDSDQEILVDSSATPQFGKVAYTKYRPTKPTIDDFSDADLFFTKSDVWAYENEWRIVDKHQAASGRPGPKAFDTWLFRVNPKAIIEVTCGYKGGEAREPIQNFLRRKEYEHVVLKVAALDQRLFKIRRDEYPRTLWDYVYLDTLPSAPSLV